MSSKTTLPEEFTTGPYTFRFPVRVSLDKCVPCFSCSGELALNYSTKKYIAIQATCIQDNIVRIFHINCWNSDKSNKEYRAIRVRESQEEELFRSKLRISRGE